MCPQSMSRSRLTQRQGHVLGVNLVRHLGPSRVLERDQLALPPPPAFLLANPTVHRLHAPLEHRSKSCQRVRLGCALGCVVLGGPGRAGRPGGVGRGRVGEVGLVAVEDGKFLIWGDRLEGRVRNGVGGRVELEGHVGLDRVVEKRACDGLHHLSAPASVRESPPARSTSTSVCSKPVTPSNSPIPSASAIPPSLPFHVKT